MPKARTPRPAPDPPALAELLTIPLDLVADPNLPARETMDVDAMEDLKASLRELGLLSPVVVVRRGSAFEVVAGHRRTLAARALGWRDIRALVYPEGWRDADAAMLHENIIREQLNAAQEAVFFAQLLEKHALDEEGLCRLVRRSPDYIGDRLDLLRKDPVVFAALRESKITYAVARVLNRFPEEQIRRYHLDQAIRSGTSARVVQQWWEEWKSYHVPDAVRVDQTTVLPPSVTGDIQPTVICFACGGWRDPYNMEPVFIHKWERQEFVQLLAAARMRVEEEAAGVTVEGPTADKTNGGA